MLQGTTAVVDRLRADGYRITISYVRWLMRDHHLEPPGKLLGGLLAWTAEDFTRLRDELDRRGRGPTVAAADRARG